MQSIAAVPQIIEDAVYVSSEENIDKAKHPDVTAFDYYLCGLNIGGEEYTVKAVVSNMADGSRYYDHKLTSIEKGRLIDFVNKIGAQKSSVSISTQTPDNERLQLKDKRLYSVCQCPQSIYLDKNLLPKKESVEAVHRGNIWLEKDENGIQILHDKTQGKEILVGKD